MNDSQASPDDPAATPNGDPTAADAQADPAGADAQADAAAGIDPAEEEMRRKLEEQMRSATVGDIVVQSVVGIINLSARRLEVEEERDLDQVRLGIDAVRALVDLLPR
ncbi:MAG TPA: hypothetical protein VFD37_00575, partial [Solirubrobacterales bacterium]|nr:hypothetical protein [Solirubrobacterales bacterium]